MGEALLAAAAFGLVGLVLVLLGFKAFDVVTPKIDVQKELTENKNNAVAIVAAAVIIGVAIVVSKAIAG
jgi:putative membrane protein